MIKLITARWIFFHLQYSSRTMRVANGTLKDAIDGETSLVFSNKITSYLNIEDYVDILRTKKLSGQITKEALKWAHITIENAKTALPNFIK